VSTTKKIKILHVFDHSIPIHSGYTFRSRSILKKQRELDFDTCHVTSAKHGNRLETIEEVEGLTFYRTKPAKGLLSSLPVLNQFAYVQPMVDRILEVITIEKPDVIHAHSPALNGLAAIKAGRKANIPVVYEIRAFWEDAAVDHGTCKEGDLRYKMTRALESYVVKRANAVTTICEGLRSDLIARGVTQNKLTVIPNAVNIEQFEIITGKHQNLLQELGLEGAKVLGFLGSFYAYEGLDLLVKALPEIIKQEPSTKLLLVGGGPQEQELKTLVKNLRLTEHVIFTGRVPHAEVDKYYSLVDLLVYPRKAMRLTELVTPLKPLEAMAQGKIVLASDVGGHHELIEQGKTGYMFKADDLNDLSQSVISILSDQKQWPAIISQGRDFVENVRNWQQSVSHYIGLYDNLLGRR